MTSSIGIHNKAGMPDNHVNQRKHDRHMVSNLFYQFRLIDGVVRVPKPLYAKVSKGTDVVIKH